jgi:Predicted glycosylase
VSVPAPSLIVSHTPGMLRPDPRRVVTRLFVPGDEQLIHGQSRVNPVLERIMELDATAAGAALDKTLALFEDRHSDLRPVLQEHFELVAHRLGATVELPKAVRLLIGAYFTHEYSLEAAALFNPSIVEHPDQRGLAAGELRVVLSLRAVGEGHRSAIEFRTGVVGVDGQLRLDQPAGHITAGRRVDSRYDRDQFHRALSELGDDAEDAVFVIDSLPDRFTSVELEDLLATFHGRRLTRHTADRTIAHLRWIAACNYEVTYPADSVLDQRVLMPRAPSESNGMEDARFVRFVDDLGMIIYHATYTAYDGHRVTPQLLSTNDFRTFSAAQLTGVAATNKGMALFPRPVRGRHLALSRWDRENISVASSMDGYAWDQPITIATPRRAWELIQIGNCGSPVETPEGWLVLTHGVGPMRRYSIGAMLLDIDDPTRVRGQLAEPLIEPTQEERDGYVPNVAYTCGALVHGDRLVVPYGSADSSIGVAVVDLPRLLSTMVDG